MEKFDRQLKLWLVKVLNVIMITMPFAACWYGYYLKGTVSPFYRKGSLLLLALFCALYIIVGKVYDAFLVSFHRISEIVYSQALASAVADCVMYIVICLLSKKFVFLLPGLACWAGQIALAAVWAFWAHRWYFAVFPPRRTVFVYDQDEGLESLIDEYELKGKFEVVRSISVWKCLDELDTLNDAETVFLSGIRSHERNIILKYCIGQGIPVYLIPRIGDVLMSAAVPVHMFHLPIMRVRRYEPTVEYLFAKRVMDIVVSGIAAILLAPVMLVVALCIKMEDGGPVLYKQERLTKDGKPFNILKFRSMRVDAEKDGVARLSTGASDDRITKVGRVIRACRLDELPQILNILEGSMSLVGPRAERASIAAEYEKEIPEFALRLQAKAGLTGYAQVYGKYNTTPYNKLQMDLMYIAHPSILEDIRIIFATVKILFMPESTEGVSEGQATALK